MPQNPMQLSPAEMAPRQTYRCELPLLPVGTVIVDDVEVEHEHTSVFDDDGRETERYDGEGKLIEPCDTSRSPVITVPGKDIKI
jgi:hypothetical protein